MIGSILSRFVYRIDTGDDNKISKEEFTADSVKPTIEKWVGSIEDWEAEFDKVHILSYYFKKTDFKTIHLIPMTES